jgi:hypothetical protein
MAKRTLGVATRLALLVIAQAFFVSRNKMPR